MSTLLMHSIFPRYSVLTPPIRTSKALQCTRRGEFWTKELPWGEWESFKLATGVLGVHLVADYCSVQLGASTVGAEVSNLSYAQIALIGLLQSTLQLSFLLWLKYKNDSPSWFCTIKLSFKEVIEGLVLGGFIVSLLYLVISFLPGDFNSDLPIGERIIFERESNLSFTLEAISAVVTTPIVEEIVHRGIIFTCLARSTGNLPSLLLSSFLFAGCHFSLQAFPELFLTGIMFTVGYLASEGNLLVPIIAHSVVNAIGIWQITH